MSEIDVERNRMYARITATWFACLFGIIIGLYFLVTIFEHYSDYDTKWLILGTLATLLGFKIQPRIEVWYEKRFLESRKRDHTT